MGECSDDRCCCSCSCSCHSKQGDGCCNKKEDSCQDKMTDYFLEIADCAWEELLKEKIKEHILATQNDKITELAKTIAEANCRKWKNKIEKKQIQGEFKSSICCHFGNKCSK